ncbi:MAG: MBL fold metallo-hydrolase [Bacteroidales bacterium]|nr:MBL fold metallo-hydrolase [Bacteroidales bacterium]
MTKYKKIKTTAQYNLFNADDNAEKEIIGDFEVILPKKEEKKCETKVTDESDGFGAVVTAPEHSPLYFMSFGSGSSGNCSYVGTENGGILIDAGVDHENVFEVLRKNGVTPDMVKGVCLTHDHSDHIRYAYGIARKYKHIRIYCTNRSLNGILKRHSVSRRIKDYHQPIFKEIEFKLGDLTITPFEVPHDGLDNVGFFVEYGDSKFVAATDLGKVTERAHHYMSQADFLMIEANYDLDMLENGTYAEHLKSRIKLPTGHLDNEDTARFIDEIYTKKLRYIFLCHLSNDNNTPEKALAAVRGVLEAKNVSVGDAMGALEDFDKDVQLMALPRYDCSPWFVLR